MLSDKFLPQKTQWTVQREGLDSVRKHTEYDKNIYIQEMWEAVWYPLVKAEVAH